MQKSYFTEHFTCHVCGKLDVRGHRDQWENWKCCNCSDSNAIRYKN